MDNMKARAFVETEMPLPALADADAQERLDGLAAALVRRRRAVAWLLRGAVRAALFSPGATVKLDSELLSGVRERFWERTETPFFAALHSAARRGATEPHPESVVWLKLLRDTALVLFDDAAPLAADSGAAAPRASAARGATCCSRCSATAATAKPCSTCWASPCPRRKPRKARSA